MRGELGMSTSGRWQQQRRRSGRVLRMTALAGLCLVAGSATPAQAATQTLHAAPAVAGAADCSSSADACTIETAVTTANAASVADDVVIKVAGGAYPLPAPSPTALPITFAGPSLTIEADGGTPVLDGADTVRLLSVDAASTVTIDGLEFKDGGTAGLGGGILNSGTLTVRNSTFSSNRAGNGGGVLSAAGSTLTVRDTTFSANTTTGVGGGAILAQGTVTIERSAFRDNTAPLNGGAINVQGGGSVTVTSSTFTGNTSASIGGALSNLGTLTVQASTIAANSGSGGSAIATGNANVTFAATIIGAQTAGPACNPVNTAIVDAGYNLDHDGTCIADPAVGTGSHAGPTAYESTTYAAAIDAFLADAPADNGGPTQTLAVLNTPDPSTTVANPLFEVVPPSFDLPVAVGGEASACALPDQRGVVPVAGASCAIGAYLLRSTTTALAASADTVVQNASVTYTATITPAASGGTVAFADGAGNPATANCAAQPVSNGTATCTVSYPAVGEYPVTATYSGDGAGNNFKGSASTATSVRVVAPPPVPPAPTPTPTPAAPAPDRTPPRTTIRRIASVRQPITLRGTATDAGSVRRVRVSVARKVGKLCRFLRADRTFSPARSCRRTSYVTARGTTSWSLKLPPLAAGRYLLWSRGIDAAGNVERKNSSRNLRSLRIARR